MKNKIKNIGILCSGGDSPGMNCAIRAVVRTSIYNEIKPFGIMKGYSGLLEENIKLLDASSVGNIMQRGGTILHTSRCQEFYKEETRKKAASIINKNKIDALVVIGGNGSFNGAWALYSEHKIPVVGIPATIDNDITGTDYSIGFDTAVHTAVSAVDKIRDTAHSHERTFIIEVMGRRSPAIAIHVGICTGAENIILPNKEVNYQEIYNDVQRGINRGKRSSIIICAEGAKAGVSSSIKKYLKEKFNLDTQICILGHIQRGGNPSVLDRFLASRMGFVAVESLLSFKNPVVTAFENGRVTPIAFEKCLVERTEYLPYFLEVNKILSI